MNSLNGYRTLQGSRFNLLCSLFNLLDTSLKVQGFGRVQRNLLRVQSPVLQEHKRRSPNGSSAHYRSLPLLKVSVKESQEIENRNEGGGDQAVDTELGFCPQTVDLSQIAWV
jgi:hypothetical protein